MQKLLTIHSLYIGVNGVPVDLGLTLVSLTHMLKRSTRVARNLIGIFKVLLEIIF